MLRGPMLRGSALRSLAPRSSLLLLQPLHEKILDRLRIGDIHLPVRGEVGGSGFFKKIFHGGAEHAFVAYKPDHFFHISLLMLYFSRNSITQRRIFSTERFSKEWD